MKRLLKFFAPKVAKWWIKKRPIRTWRTKRQRRVAGYYPDEVFEEFNSEVSMNSGFPQQLVLAVLRHGLTFAGGAGLFTDNDLAQISAAIATIVGLVWSGVRKWKAAKE